MTHWLALKCRKSRKVTQGYRLGTLNQLQVGRLLGLSRMETEDFLAEHADLYKF